MFNDYFCIIAYNFEYINNWGNVLGFHPTSGLRDCLPTEDSTTLVWKLTLVVRV